MKFSVQSFMVDFLQISIAVAKFLVPEWRLDMKHVYAQFLGLPEICSFPKIINFKSFGNSWDNLRI